MFILFSSLEGKPVILGQVEIDAFNPHHPGKVAPQLAWSQGSREVRYFNSP